MNEGNKQGVISWSLSIGSAHDEKGQDGIYHRIPIYRYDLGDILFSEDYEDGIDILKERKYRNNILEQIGRTMCHEIGMSPEEISREFNGFNAEHTKRLNSGLGRMAGNTDREETPKD